MSIPRGRTLFSRRSACFREDTHRAMVAQRVSLRTSRNFCYCPYIFMTSEALTSKPKGSAADKKKTVFLFLVLRIYMSDLLRTDYIKALSEKNRVIVFLRELEGEAPQEYYKNEHITYRTFKEPGGKFWTLFDGIFRNELIRIFDDNPTVIWRNSIARDKRRLAQRPIM